MAEKFRRQLFFYQKLLIGVFIIRSTFSLISIFILHDSFFLSQNIGALFFYLAIELFSRKVKPNEKASYFLFFVMIELMVQTILSGIYGGWELGFQNYCFISITASYFHSIENPKAERRLHHRIILFFSILTYIIIAVVTHLHEPFRSFTRAQILIVHLSNSAGIFVVAIAFSSVFKTRYKDSLKRLRDEADRDELTQLYNRHAIRQRFDKVKDDYTFHNRPFAIAILDIDDFKVINDTYGHNIGDDVLARISNLMAKYESTKTTNCRWGGEEFLILEQYGTNQAEFVQKIDNLRRQISELSFAYPDKQIYFSITITAGISFSEPDLPIHELIDKADNRMYWGKRHNKNQTVFTDY